MLRALLETFLAGDAGIGAAVFGNLMVVATEFADSARLTDFVLGLEDGRNFDAGGAGDAVLAGCAGDDFAESAADVFNECLFTVVQRFEIGESLDVLFEMFGFDHA